MTSRRANRLTGAFVSFAILMMLSNSTAAFAETICEHRVWACSGSSSPEIAKCRSDLLSDPVCGPELQAKDKAEAERMVAEAQAASALKIAEDKAALERRLAEDKAASEQKLAQDKAASDLEVAKLNAAAAVAPEESRKNGETLRSVEKAAGYTTIGVTALGILSWIGNRLAGAIVIPSKTLEQLTGQGPGAQLDPLPSVRNPDGSLRRPDEVPHQTDPASGAESSRAVAT